MKFEVRWIDVSEHLARRVAPVYMLERPLSHGDAPRGNLFNTAEVARLGTYWVPQGPLLTDSIEWTFTSSGTHVRIPVFAYRTASRALAGIWASGVQIGIEAVAAYQQKTLIPPSSAILILGHECTDLGDAFRCYIGLALAQGE